MPPFLWTFYFLLYTFLRVDFCCIFIRTLFLRFCIFFSAYSMNINYMRILHIFAYIKTTMFVIPQEGCFPP